MPELSGGLAVVSLPCYGRRDAWPETPLAEGAMIGRFFKAAGG
jgi:hypothetical protein